MSSLQYQCDEGSLKLYQKRFFINGKGERVILDRHDSLQTSDYVAETADGKYLCHCSEEHHTIERLTKLGFKEVS